MSRPKTTITSAGYQIEGQSARNAAAGTLAPSQQDGVEKASRS